MIDSDEAWDRHAAECEPNQALLSPRCTRQVTGPHRENVGGTESALLLFFACSATTLLYRRSNFPY